MKKEQNEYNASKVINTLLQEVGMSAPTFAASIGMAYSRIFDIQSGRVKRITEPVFNAIVKKYPEINRNFLNTGEGSVFVIHEDDKQLESPRGLVLIERLINLIEKIDKRQDELEVKLAKLHDKEMELMERERALGIEPHAHA